MKKKNCFDYRTADITKVSPDVRRQFAKDFSEGCPELEHLLLTLWSNGVQTRGTCSGYENHPGHKDQGSSNVGRPYISIHATPEVKNRLANMVAQLQEQDFAGIIVRVSSDKRFGECLTFDGPNMNDEQASNFFANITDAFVRSREKQHGQSLPKAQLLAKVLQYFPRNDLPLNTSVAFHSGEPMLGISCIADCYKGGVRHTIDDCVAVSEKELADFPRTVQNAVAAVKEQRRIDNFLASDYL